MSSKAKSSLLSDCEVRLFQGALFLQQQIRFCSKIKKFYYSSATIPRAERTAIAAFAPSGVRDWSLQLATSFSQ